MLAALAGLTAATAPATAASSPVRVGIKLLDAPVSKEADQRARKYIIDHLAPGAVIHRRLQVVNEGANPLPLWLYPGAASVHNGQFKFADAETTNELTGWITLDRDSLEIAPHGRAIVSTTVSVPPDATPGERYAVVWAEHRSPPGPDGNVGINSRVGVRVYLDVGPGGEPASDFAVDQLVPARSPDGHPQLSARIRNTGGRAVDITGTLSLSDGPGGLSAGPFPVEHGPTVAPGGTATATIVLGKGLPGGPWRATLTLRSGLVERTSTATITFPDSGTATPVSVTTAGSNRLWWVGAAAAVLAIAAALVLIRRKRLATRS